MMIMEEIYSAYEKARKNNWKMGKLHNEWNELLLNNKGLIIKAPRDHLKTFFFFEARALQLCKFNSDIEIRYFTGSDSMAIEKLENVKKFARLPYFKNLLINANVDNKTEIRFGNDSRIYVQGFWSKTRGGHPDYIILDDVIDSQVIYSDDANKKSKERLTSEILPMASPHTQIVIIGTLQREDDIYSVNYGKGWVSKSYDAIVGEGLTLFPEKWDWDSLMRRKEEITASMGEKWFLKEYRNIAVNLRGDIIKKDWIKFYDEPPKNADIYFGCDLSVGKDPDKGDYTAIVIFALDKNGNYFIIRAYRDRIDFPTRLKKIVELANFYKPKEIRIESNTFQADSVQVLKKNTSLPIIGVKTTENKVKKFNEELAPLIENEKVFFKKDDEQKIFIDELLSLPYGKYDDLCDAFCIGIKGLRFQNKPIAFWI